MKVSVFRKTHFNAAHRLHNPDLTEEENQQAFGKCNNEYYHGHNYDLIVKVTGEVSGFFTTREYCVLCLTGVTSLI